MKDPLFMLNNTQCQHSEEEKYLGVFIHKDGTNCDVEKTNGEFSLK